ncbi:MAG: DUF255 domain-containing protein [Pirellulaceae bacterium]
MNQKLITAFFSGIVVLTSTVLNAEDGVQWLDSVSDAKVKARIQNRVVLVHFWSTTCPPCRKLEQTVFASPEFARSINEGYIPVKINTREQPDLAKRFRIRRIPTDVYLTPEGAEVFRTISPQDPKVYIESLDRVAARVRELKRPQAEAIAAARRRAAEFAPGSTVAAPDIRQVATRTTPASRYVGDRQVPGSRMNNPHFATGARANPVPAYGQKYAPESQSGHLNNQDEESVMVANRATPHQSMSSGVQEQITDLQDFALLGYCPVTLVDSIQWQPGDRRWGAIHEGQTYLFTSVENQQIFLANPQRFAPGFRGFDPVYFHTTGQLVVGTCDFGVVYDLQYYLFANEASLQRFWKQPEMYYETVRQAMARSRSRR